MDIIRKNPTLIMSISFATLFAVMIGLSAAKLNSWNSANAQEDALVSGSFACEPLVFTLSDASETSGTGTPSATPTATPRGTAGTGGISPTPSATPIASGTPRASASPTASAKATAKATSTGTPKPAQLPDAGISTPTLVGIAAGFLLLLAAALLAL